MKAKYPDAMPRIEAESSLHADGMDEDQFWAILALFDWNKPDREGIMAPAVEALAGFSKADIEAFHNLMNEKLYALDGQRFAEQLGSNRYVEGEFFSVDDSVDDFLYSRCQV